MLNVEFASFFFFFPYFVICKNFLKESCLLIFFFHFYFCVCTVYIGLFFFLSFLSVNFCVCVCNFLCIVNYAPSPPPFFVFFNFHSVPLATFFF